MRKHTVVHDFLLNFLASFVTTATVQFLLYPILARNMEPDQYGLVLTLMGIGNTITGTFGGSLNNVRLMMNTDYEERNLRGDFQPLLLALTLFGSVSLVLYLILVYKLPCFLILTLGAFAAAGILRGYGIVDYRLLLNYRKNLICSLMVALGNILGILLLLMFGKWLLWTIPFLLGEISGVIYLSCSGKIFKEPLRFTPLLKVTLSKEALLILTTLIGNVLVYLDRLLLLPVLGGEAVSVYTVASFFGKSLGVVMTPLAGVLLSYYAAKDFKMNVCRFWQTNILTMVLSGAFFVGCMIFSAWGTGLLYPTLIESARPYLLLANLSAILTVAGNMTQPAVLKFAPTYWQVVIQVVYSFFYLGLGLLGARTYGLMGFTFVAVITSALRLIMLFCIGHVFILKIEKN